MLGPFALAFAVLLAPPQLRLEIDGVEAGQFASFGRGTAPNIVTLRGRFGELSTAFSRQLTQMMRGKGTAATATMVDLGSGVRRTMTGMWISKVSFSSLDASSESPAHVTVALKYETLDKPAGKAPAAVSAAKTVGSEQAERKSHFSVIVGGLPCDRVSKVDAFSIEQKIVDGVRTVDLSDIGLTIDAADLEPWQAAIGTKGERTGTITIGDGEHSCTVGLTINQVVSAEKRGAHGRVTLAATANGFRCR